MAKVQKRPNLDSVTTINEDGSHMVLHPADVRGPFTFWRKIFGFVLIGIYIALPMIPINGQPAVFFDIINRNFHLFGITLITQDLWVLFFLVSGLGFTLFFVTAILGRLWCGWACPYTVFLEHIFRRIERWIDGDAPSRKKLAAAEWSSTKLVKRAIKYALYTVAAGAIAHIFLSYFISIPRLWSYMAEGPFAHPFAFAVVVFLTGALLFSFAWFREQFCIILCPYGRIQSALSDDDTIVIGYDEVRGEPRGKRSDPNAGDCVDCLRCVQVCPTGIDIRAGLQMECVGCAACIDACDEIMGKIGRSKGLVRYDSMNGLSGKKRRLLRPRVYAYALLAALGLGVMTTTVYLKAKPVFAEVNRMRGKPFFTDETSVRNHFEIQLINKRNQPVTFTISLEEAPENAALSGFEEIVLGPLADETRPVVVRQPAADYIGPADLKFRIHAEPGESEITREARFLGPNAYMLRESLGLPPPGDTK